jgi:predicted nucleotide-binding protein (sugar kinase/HSP70/actin superfamily)
MNDNRILTALVRAMGFTAIDNYDDEHYDLEQKGRKGRQYVGDTVCLPLAAVFADMLTAVERFMEMKRIDHPLYREKQRLVLFMHGGDGPCRLGQYIHVLKLIFYRIFGRAKTDISLPDARHDHMEIRLLENVSSSLNKKDDCTAAFEPWVGMLGYQGLVIHGLLLSLFLDATSNCRDEAQFNIMRAEYWQLKNDIVRHIEFKARPGKAGSGIADAVSRNIPSLGGIARYFGYGLFHNFGLRKFFRSFAGRWIIPYRKQRNGEQKIRIHLDGEVYMRTTQVETIVRLLTDQLGFGVFELTMAPTWCFIEAVLLMRVLAARDRMADLEHELKSGDISTNPSDLHDSITAQAQIAAAAEQNIRNLRNLLAKPLYKDAMVPMPHSMHDIYAAAQPIIATGKPYGELVPFVGEAVLKCREGIDLILNVSPEGCMVSGMGDMLIPSILAAANSGRQTDIVTLCSRNGEVDEEKLLIALLKTLVRKQGFI